MPEVDGVRPPAQALQHRVAQHAVVGIGPQDHRRAEHRQHEPGPCTHGAHPRSSDQECADQHQRQAEMADPCSPEPASRRLREQRHQCAGQQFPHACGQQEEAALCGATRQPQVPRQGQQHHQRHASHGNRLAACPRRPAREHDQQQRVEQVELPLHRERPGVQQPQRIARMRDVAAVREEVVVRDEHQRAHALLGQAQHVEGRQPRRTGHEQQQHQRSERRPDARGTAHEVVGVAEATGVEPAPHHLRHQVARQHEEHVDADEAAGRPLELQMEGDDERDRQAAQPVEIDPVVVPGSAHAARETGARRSSSATSRSRASRRVKVWSASGTKSSDASWRSTNRSIALPPCLRSRS